jgi:hypothetical protein
MRIFAFLLFALPALGAPVLGRIDPSYGFRFGPTEVTIEGSGFAEPAQVFFGDVPAVVHEVTPTRIRLTVQPAHAVPAGTDVDVRVVIAGQGEATRTRGFTYYDVSEGLANYAQYLVPFTSEIVSGANGSRWTGELALFNGSAFSAIVLGPFADPRFLSPPLPEWVELAPRRSEKPPILGSGRSAGAFLYVPRPLDGNVRTSLRIRDLSRNANSWGTAIPIVSRDDAATAITLIDIPTDAQYRATLRVYHWSDADGLPARVTVYAPDRTEPVAQFDVQSYSPGATETDMPFYPSYSQVDLLTPEVRAAGATIRVEVESVIPIWGFVSVTNNDTQQVTVMTP